MAEIAGATSAIVGQLPACSEADHVKVVDRESSSKGNGAMPEYRSYLIDSDGHFFSSASLNCVDDADAVKQAEQIVQAEGHDVEVWQGVRKIARFDFKS